MVEEVTIDDARDQLYTALRACERFADNLKKVVEELSKKQNDEEWLELVQTTCSKAASFHEVQGGSWHNFSGKMDDFVEALKQEAEALAIAEIKGNTDGEEYQSLIHRRESRTLHPELHKFKLEKQAKVLGMGGAPAVGSGMALPKRSSKDVLKATGSAAAREIQALWEEEVRTRHSVPRGAANSTPSPANLPTTPISAELSDRLAARQARLTEEDLNKASLSAIPTTPELAAALKKRQDDLAQAAASPSGEATPPPTELSATFARRSHQQGEATPASTSTPVDPLAGATDELTSKLARRQTALSEAGTPLPYNPAHPPRTPMSDMVNSELAERLRRRRMEEGGNNE